ncbi:MULTISPECIES: AAA-like domain-containing protein [unclassified Coleofasciculus]|uniref:AAA-like domain-containing protein n=1 Tax=unclassified Coleofasciculus TaxID=2692782 RepID=UPI0018812164|nr:MULTISPECIES: AAA-like domain-containing protein [unclassified Coleofasciculus]MBE9125197.1 AAA-like domain-containing protein [Coleofasciculus sp. LEGE 07081]MBE9148774.1 AAA-like domain-containing protein [Coleofasciculus sp. LEGE 07092]
MNQAEFTQALAGLTPRQEEVLVKILVGEKDAEIANQLHITQGTVRKHVENICKTFGLSDLQDPGFNHRPDLIALFAKYRPDLFSGGTQTHPNRTKILLSYYRGTNPDKSLADQLEDTLQASGYDIFVASNSRRMATNGLRQICTQLNQCDGVLILLSKGVAGSEMVTEEVRLAKTLRDRTPEGKPWIVPILINCPINSLNHDLRGYLQGMPQQEWHSAEDTSAIAQAVLELLSSGVSRDSAFTPLKGTAKIVRSPIPDTLTLNSPPQPVAEPELPRGQVELASAFYVVRSRIDNRCYEEIAKPGALIRIKAPRQMGKTSLMARILHHATTLKYRTVPLSFQLADSSVFNDLDRFLQWFCAVIALELQLPDQLAKYWNGVFGSKISCKSYFERYLLTNVTEPLVLGLDEVDRVFQYPELSSDFFGLLRAWHEESKNREIWRKLRLVVVHSTEVYVPMDINQSPFNVGLPIELPEFNTEQIEELAARHGLAWGASEVEQLMAIVGGHPYLVRLALYHIARQEMTLEQLLETAPTDSGLYSDHLRRHLWMLSQQPTLAAAFNKVVIAEKPVQLEPIHGFKLYSLGLVNLQGNEVTLRCDLYRQYFRIRSGNFISSSS